MAKSLVEFPSATYTLAGTTGSFSVGFLDTEGFKYGSLLATFTGATSSAGVNASSQLLGADSSNSSVQAVGSVPSEYFNGFVADGGSYQLNGMPGAYVFPYVALVPGMRLSLINYEVQLFLSGHSGDTVTVSFEVVLQD